MIYFCATILVIAVIWALRGIKRDLKNIKKEKKRRKDLLDL